jgi:ketosteroid isomerase-like protein
MSSSESVVRAFERFAERFNAGDMDGFDAAIAEDADSFVIGTQRWTSGRAEWLGNYQALLDAGLVGPDGAGLRVEPSGLRGFDEGSAGWAVGWVTFVFPDGTRLPSRATAVFRSDEGGWKLRHFHFSVAVPDEVAGAQAAQWLEELGQARE